MSTYRRGVSFEIKRDRYSFQIFQSIQDRVDIITGGEEIFQRTNFDVSERQNQTIFIII